MTRRFQAEVLRIAALLALRVRRAAMRADSADIEAWWQGVADDIRREILVGQSATARLARAYLRQHAAIEGVSLAPAVVELSAEQAAEALRITGPVAFRTHMADTGSPEASVRTMATRLEGSATRLVLAGARETTMQTFRENDRVAGWRRVGAGACAFCSLLISRGAVYSRESVKFQAHDHDRCTPELVYRHEPEPPEVRALYEQYKEATAGLTGKAAIEAWRKHWDARQAQARAQAARAQAD